MAEYIDKQSLIGEIAENLKSILVVTELEKVTPVILETLSYYEVSRVAQREDSVKTSADILKMFLDAKCVEGRTGKTLERYEYILNHFFEHENVSACEVTSYHIRDYFMKEKTRGISDATIGGYRYVLSSFYGWLFNEGLIGKNPCRNVGTIKQEKKVRKAFSQVEIQKMLDACKTKRDKAIIMFLLTTGCRVSEVCALNVADVDLRTKECIVYGKGRKERTVYFDDVTAWMLSDYLESYNPWKSAPLFGGKGATRLMCNGLRSMLKRIETASGVENIHPHRFRRTFATNMINKGMPIQEVAALMGHDKIDTTMTYIYQTKEKVKSSYERYSG